MIILKLYNNLNYIYCKPIAKIFFGIIISYIQNLLKLITSIQLTLKRDKF